MNDGPGRERLPIIRVLGVAAIVVLTGGMGVFRAGPAVADPAPLTLQYTCSFPLIGDQSMTTSLVWNASATHVAGQATPRLPVNASATVGPTFAQALGLVGAKTVEGTADATAVVATPQGDISVTTPLNVSETDVPESGSMTFGASGTTPSLVFSQPGNAQITIGGLSLHMTPRSANGGLTVVGEVDTSCELIPGQNDVLASFRILSAGGSTTRPANVPPTAVPGPIASGTPGIPTSPNASGSTHAAGPAASAGPHPDASDIASGTATPAVADDPRVASPAPASTIGSDPMGPLLMAAGVPAVGAAACGFVWWLRRSRGAVDGPED